MRGYATGLILIVMSLLSFLIVQFFHIQERETYYLLIALLCAIAITFVLSSYLIHKKIIENNIALGLLIFLFISVSMVVIVLTPTLGFSAINDIITSLLFVIGFLLAMSIYLINRNVISNYKAISFIQRIPDYVPFSHALKEYLLSLITVEYKVIALLRSLDEKNSEWVLNQIAAYNHIIKNDKTIFGDTKKIEVEFLFVDNHSDDINRLIENLNITQYRYIIITSLSAIFRETIIARENTDLERRKAIQVIGALSSINDKKIEKIIDRDDDIIRIFPPDYDEAKTAIDFIFSKIKSTICTAKECKLYHQKNNIIIIHNGTYGRAVRDQCQRYYDKEMNKIYNNTIQEMGVLDLQHALGFYSFDYKSDTRLVYDGIKSQSFELFLEEWQEAKNYFLIIGYEPNISSMIRVIDEKFTKHPPIDKCFIFSGTLSMKSWRDEVIETFEKSKTLRENIEGSYYLKLLIYSNRNNPFIHGATQTLNLKFHKFNQNLEYEEVDLKEILMNILSTHDKAMVENLLNYYLKKEESYISIFSALSLLIAQYSVKNKTTLLKSKSKVLYEYKDEIDILVNGDSINQYVISCLKE